MERFITLVSLKIEHDYYQSSIARHVSLTPLAETERLMHRRGVRFFRDNGSWKWIIQDDCAGFGDEDVLEFSLHMANINFLRITKLNDYRPQNFHRLILGSEKKINAASALKATEEKKWQPELCRISMKLTDESLKKAKDGEPIEYTLKFEAMAYRWEYLFVIRNESLKNLLLEETKDRITFNKLERLKNNPFGENVWGTISTAPVIAQEYPEYVLILSELLSNNPLKKQTVSRFLPCPQPGRYQTDQQNAIRQICYL